MSEEIWQSLPTHPIYEVSTHGRLRRLLPNNRYRIIRGSLDRTHPDGGYLSITLPNNGCKGRRKDRNIHQIVFETFCGAVPLGKEINHKDSIKTNNQLNNLEAVTRRENLLHAIHILKVHRARGEKQAFAKLKEKDIPVILSLYGKGEKQKRIAERFSVDISSIHSIVHGKTWRHITVPLGVDTLQHDGKLKGSRHNLAKLTENDIPLIRSFYAEGQSCSMIAIQYKVSQSAIHLIVTRQRWRHVL